MHVTKPFMYVTYRCGTAETRCMHQTRWTRSWWVRLVSGLGSAGCDTPIHRYTCICVSVYPVYPIHDTRYRYFCIFFTIHDRYTCDTHPIFRFCVCVCVCVFLCFVFCVCVFWILCFFLCVFCVFFVFNFFFVCVFLCVFWILCFFFVCVLCFFCV